MAQCERWRAGSRVRVHADGTFWHPHFTAKFVIKDIKTVELNRKGGEQAVMTFSDDYSTFEVLDFDKARRITGKRLPK